MCSCRVCSELHVVEPAQANDAETYEQHVLITIQQKFGTRVVCNTINAAVNYQPKPTRVTHVTSSPYTAIEMPITTCMATVKVKVLDPHRIFEILHTNELTNCFAMLTIDSVNPLVSLMNKNVTIVNTTEIKEHPIKT